MKNIRLIVPVIICLALGFYILGCGSVTGGGGGGGGTSYFGKLSDPYLAGARVFTDYDGDSVYDPADGEMISNTTEADGGFNFTADITMDCTMRIYNTSEVRENGVTYEAPLSFPYSTLEPWTETIFVTPLTTCLANNITAAQVVYLLTKEADISPVTVNDIKADPMQGIADIVAGDSSTDEALAKIRAAQCIYSIMMVMNDIQSNAYFDFASMESGQGPTQLANMGTMVKGSISKALIDSINASIESGATQGVTLPKVTALDIANTAAAVTKRLIQKVIDSKPAYTAPSAADVALFAGKLGIRYYCLRTQTNSNIHYALDHGYMTDSVGTPITLAEIQNSQGFFIDSSDSVEAIPK